MGIGIKKIKTLVVLFVAFLVISYAIFQMIDIVRGPIIKIDYPTTGTTLNQSVIEIKGTIKNIAFATINGKQMFVDADGKFSEIVLLSEGYNVTEIEVKDKFGRIEKRKLELVYMPQQ